MLEETVIVIKVGIIERMSKERQRGIIGGAPEEWWKSSSHVPHQNTMAPTVSRVKVNPSARALL